MLFDSVRGDLKTKAAIAVLYEKKAGAKQNEFFNNLDVMNLPNPTNPEISDVILQDFNFYQLMFVGDKVKSTP